MKILLKNVQYLYRSIFRTLVIKREYRVFVQRNFHFTHNLWKVQYFDFVLTVFEFIIPTVRNWLSRYAYPL